MKSEAIHHAHTMGSVSHGLVKLVRRYQQHISPLKPAPTCRFTPTCSEYAALAIERHGAVMGSWLAAWRIMRCNPLVPGGFDPVPEHFPKWTQTQIDSAQINPAQIDSNKKPNP